MDYVNNYSTSIGTREPQMAGVADKIRIGHVVAPTDDVARRYVAHVATTALFSPRHDLVRQRILAPAQRRLVPSLHVGEP